jgi:N-methylhydantoinase A
VGGTFTDVVALDLDRKTVTAAKAPTTPGDLIRGILESTERLGVPLAAVERIVHGSTTCTNALIEGTQAKTGFIGTRGFSDEFDIQRMVRRWGATPWASIYDLHQRKPAPYVPRRLRREVDERVLHDGAVLTPLDPEELAREARALVADGVEAVGVCFLWSPVNDVHERQARAILAEVAAGCAVSVSSDVAPVVHEYERMVTTAVNASLMPVMGDYLIAIEHQLAQHGFRGTLRLMQSHGGTAPPDQLGERPIATLRSGPVGGAVAAARLARRLVRGRVVSCDIGGTSCDTAIIADGNVPVVDAIEVESYPVQIPTADITCIGAGGGSIAAMDAGGALRVGPESAGSSPGPACYGTGGDAPTLTDANAVLGRVFPDGFAGGAVELRVDAARRVFEPLARMLGRSVEAAAHGVVTIAVENMARSIRLQTIDRGHDPRDFTLVAFGGAGPLHGTLIAEACAIPEVIVPREPGTFSSLGMVLAEEAHHAQAAFLGAVDQVDVLALGTRLEQLHRRAVAGLGEIADIGAVRRTASMRYALQEWAIRVPLPDGPPDQGWLATLRERFHAAHHERYGFARRDKPVEIVTLFVDAHAAAIEPRLDRPKAAAGDAGPARIGTASVVLEPSGAPVAVPVLQRAALHVRDRLEGPVIVAEPLCTTFVHDGWHGSVDDEGNLILRIREAHA